MAESRLMQVLLVDNDGVNRYTIRKVLQRVGYIVAEASYADEALDLLERQHFDLVLSEIHLPGADGIDLLQRCKARSPDAVVVLMTEQASVETAVNALRYGAQDYLIRPCSSDEIRDCVDRGIGRAVNLMRRRRMLDAIERNVNELAREEAEAAPQIDEAVLPQSLRRPAIDFRQQPIYCLWVPLQLCPGDIKSPLLISPSL